MELDSITSEITIKLVRNHFIELINRSGVFFFLSFFHRFSLLLLEPNEIYFEDFLVNLINEEPSDDIQVLDEQTYIGHLKMCSKSVVFDPKNLELPLIKITYKNCSRIFIWPGKVNGIESNVLAISCDQYTEMLAKSIVAPYTFKMESRTFLFNFQYAKVYEYLDQLRQLHRASKLHVCEQNDMVKEVHYGIDILNEIKSIGKLVISDCSYCLLTTQEGQI